MEKTNLRNSPFLRDNRNFRVNREQDALGLIDHQAYDILAPFAEEIFKLPYSNHQTAFPIEPSISILEQATKLQLFRTYIPELQFDRRVGFLASTDNGIAKVCLAGILRWNDDGQNRSYTWINRGHRYDCLLYGIKLKSINSKLRNMLISSLKSRIIEDESEFPVSAVLKNDEFCCTFPTLWETSY